ncbi:MAG: MFS transporter [Candidatus Yanofskybacteria bacterium]|nr:MFS transporter [Candidatus Yanofskybacteria bacterium]
MLNVFLLGLTSLLTDFASEMVVPLLPFFIQSLGGSGLALGFIFGLGDAVASLLKVISGYWADKTKKYKQFVFWGYAFSAIAKFLYPVAQSWQHISFIRPFERMGKGFRDAPRDAIVSESLTEQERGKGFGIQRAMDSTGAIIGSVAVLILYVFLDLSIQRIFLVAAIIGTGAIIPLFFVKVPKDLSIQKHRGGSGALPKKLKKFIAIAMLFALGNFSVAFFVLQAQASFFDLGVKQTLGLVLVVYIFFNLFDAAFSEPAGALSDRIGRRKVITIGYTLFSLVSLGFLIVSILMPSNTVSFFALLGLFALYGLFKAFVDASQRAYVSDLSDIDVRGTALGAFETLTGLTAIPAGLFAGYLWDANPVFTFGYGFLLAIAAVVALNLALKES